MAGKKIEKWVDLSGLPKKMHRGREATDWGRVDNHKVPFLYGDTEDCLIVSFSHRDENSQAILDVGYEDNAVQIMAGNLQKVQLGVLLKQQGVTFKPGTVVNNSLILDIIKLPSGKKYQVGYILRCLETQQLYEALHGNLKKGHGSPFLNGMKAYEGNWLYAETHLLKYLKDPEEAKLFTRTSNKKISCVCPSCEREKEFIIGNLVNQGFSCLYCSSYRSYPEKLMGSLLSMNNINYETEKRFDELGNYRFDFYIPHLGLIIETHGAQHYEPNFGEENLLNTKKSDQIKKDFCKQQDINYIALDCRKSEMEFILNSVNSNPTLVELLQNQDYEELQELITQRSRYDVKSILEDRESGMSYQKIGEKHNVARTTIIKIIKRNSITNTEDNIV